MYSIEQKYTLLREQLLASPGVYLQLKSPIRLMRILQLARLVLIELVFGIGMFSFSVILLDQERRVSPETSSLLIGISLVLALFPVVIVPILKFTFNKLTGKKTIQYHITPEYIGWQKGRLKSHYHRKTIRGIVTGKERSLQILRTKRTDNFAFGFETKEELLPFLKELEVYGYTDLVINNLGKEPTPTEIKTYEHDAQRRIVIYGILILTSLIAWAVIVQRVTV